LNSEGHCYGKTDRYGSVDDFVKMLEDRKIMASQKT
jgi:hypothetical protein